MILRHVYLLKGSWPRLLELAYWPTVQMILWGFITRFLQGHSDLLAQTAGLFLSAVLLWDVLFRSQLSVSLLFIEEMWSRHLGHLFVSPLRPWELVVSLFTMSVVRVLIGVGGAALLAIPLHHFSIFDALGPAADRVLRQPAGLRLGDGPDDRGPRAAPRPRRREPRLGADLPDPAALRRLLPDRDAAGLAPAARLVPAVRADLRGHARGPAGAAPSAPTCCSTRPSSTSPGSRSRPWSSSSSSAPPAPAACCCRSGSSRLSYPPPASLLATFSVVDSENKTLWLNVDPRRADRDDEVSGCRIYPCS